MADSALPPLTRGQRAADFVARIVGSWPFIIWQSICLTAWLVINTVSELRAIAWDREPYILLNLMLSFQAAYTGPIVMISQNRQQEISQRTQNEIHESVHRTERMERTQLAMVEALTDLVEDNAQYLRSKRAHLITDDGAPPHDPSAH